MREQIGRGLSEDEFQARMQASMKDGLMMASFEQSRGGTEKGKKSGKKIEFVDYDSTVLEKQPGETRDPLKVDLNYDNKNPSKPTTPPGEVEFNLDPKTGADPEL